MARFNKTSKSGQTETSYAGDTAYIMSPEMELYSVVCSSMLSPKFYVPNTNDQLNKIRSLITQVSPRFVAQLAVYVREQMYLRTIPMVLTVELAKVHSGDNLVSKTISRVVKRADEIAELLSYYVKANEIKPKFSEMKGGHKVCKKLYNLSNQVRKGISGVFESGKFDEYQYAKYNRKTEIRLRDAMFITHPKPQNAEMEELFNKIANNNLSVPYTWETELSNAGQEGLSKKRVWEELILSGKMGYMALLRNLRNFLNEEVSDVVINKVAERIADPVEVRRSKQLPFRFLSAYRMLAGDANVRSWGGDYMARTDVSDKLFTPIVLEALEKAVLVSIENMPIFKDENVLIATDVSSSMWSTVSEKSIIRQYDIGALLAMLSQSRCTFSIVGMFGDDWKVLSNMPSKNVLAATNDIYSREGEVGYSTNGWKVLDWAVEGYNKVGYEFDRIMMFTDAQMWDSTGRGTGRMNTLWKKYKTMVPQAKLYLFDLNSYGQTPVDLKSGDVHLISGWSDKIFDVLTSIENGGEVLDKIKSIEL